MKKKQCKLTWSWWLREKNYSSLDVEKPAMLCNCVWYFNFHVYIIWFSQVASVDMGVHAASKVSIFSADTDMKLWAISGGGSVYLFVPDLLCIPDKLEYLWYIPSSFHSGQALNIPFSCFYEQSTHISPHHEST